jgi:hypothetical protein
VLLIRRSGFIIYSAFSENIIDNEIIKQIQNTEPFKGFHYSNKLIEVIAMAKHDFEFEKNNLSEIAKNGTFKEIFIIQKVFPDFKQLSYETPKTSLDKLIQHILIQKNYDKLSSLILETLTDSTDLIDLYILECAIKEAWDLHPDRQLQQDIKLLINLHNKLEHKIKTRFKWVYGSLLAISAFFLVSLISWVILSFWDEWNLEPVLTAISISSPVISILVSLFVLKKFPNKKESFDNFIENRAKAKYLSFNILKNKLDNIREKHATKN